MEKIENPLATNILKFQNYFLAPDEFILFEWFIVKSIYNFGYSEFYQSQEKIETETRIKRRRQEHIITSFESLGIIDTQVRKNNIGGRVKYFSVNFSKLCNKDILSEIINPESELFTKFMQFFKHHAAEQKKCAKKKPEQQNSIDKWKVDNIYKDLNLTYKSRCEMHNKKEANAKNQKTIVQMPRNKTLELKITKLSETYNDKTIEMAFIAYVDYVLAGMEKPDNILNYFLDYDYQSEIWNVFEKYLNIFTKNYSYTTS